MLVPTHWSGVGSKFRVAVLQLRVHRIPEGCGQILEKLQSLLQAGETLHPNQGVGEPRRKLQDLCSWWQSPPWRA